MRLIFLLVLIVVNCISGVFAQEVKLVDMLAEESKKTLAKQKEEALKNAPPILPVAQNLLQPSQVIKPKVIKREPRTISIFGIAPAYSAEMEINGKIILLKTGHTVDGYKVGSINPSGVTLLSFVPPKKKYRPIRKVAAKKTVTESVAVEPKKFVRKSIAQTKAVANTSTEIARFFPLPKQ